MQVMPLDILIAHKVINLSTDLSNSDKRVAGVLLDHFNRKTGQCDPGQNAVADLIQMSRRTVIRSVERLERLGLFRKVRHGGKYHRNHYEPVWTSFRRVDAAWCVRRKSRNHPQLASDVSPSERQASHIGGDTCVNQTYSKNHSYKTSPCGPDGGTPPLAEAPDPTVCSPRKSKEEKSSFARQELPSLSTPSAVAARDAAERRWNDQLLDRYGKQPALFGRIVDAIDSRLMSSTTDIEMRRRGAGLSYLIAELTERESSFLSLAIAQGSEGFDV